MKRPGLPVLLPAFLSVLAGITLLLGFAPLSQAVEILRWERMPLAVRLVVGQERVIFIERNVRVGVPAHAQAHLRVQSAGGAIYLRSSKPLAPTRLQLQDVESGALILLDITAEPGKDAQAPLEPVRIVEETDASPANRYGNNADEGVAASNQQNQAAPQRQTPVALVLTRYAAQNLYAPLRTVEPVAGIARVNLRPGLALERLLPTLPVRAQALAAWRLQDQWVTAVRLGNTSGRRLDLDPRALQGDFLAATFQHPDLGPVGRSSDTTVLYLVTRGHGLAESLLPKLSPIDASMNLPPNMVRGASGVIGTTGAAGSSAGAFDEN